MSVKFEQSEFTEKEWSLIKKSLTEHTTVSGCTTTTQFFIQEKLTIYIPLAYAVKNLVTLQEPKISSVKFTAILRAHQVSVVEKALKTLKKDRACIISCPPGAGKTIMAIACIAKLGLKTGIVTNRVIIRNQWKSSLDQYCKDANVLFINLQHAVSIPDDVDFIVIDELHQNLSERAFKLLMSRQVNYILGLSATPYRYDVWDMCIPHLFGQLIVNDFTKRCHTVKIIYTNLTFPVKCKTFDNSVDWTDLITKQSMHKSRNEMIVTHLLKELSVDYWLVLCKRLDQIELLKSILISQTSKKIVCASPKVNYNALPPCIILGTPSRLGVGFDMIKINGLCLASDIINYFSQYIGRLRNPNCLVLDFVDCNLWFEKHLDERLKVYNKQMCTIKKNTKPQNNNTILYETPKIGLLKPLFGI